MSDIQKESKYLNEHIEECRNRIETIQGYIESNKDADSSECRKNIAVLQAAIAALQEKQHNDELRQQGRLVELPCALGDTAYWISDIDEDGNENDNVQKTGPIKGIAIEEDGLYIKTDPGLYDKVGSRYALLTLETAQEALEKIEAEA